MLEFLRPIIIFDTWLYIILGFVALFFVRIIILARRDRLRSIFTLERENATKRMSRAFFGLMIVLALMLGVYYLSIATPRFVPPPPDTPTPTPFAIPNTSTPALLLPTPTPSATPSPSPTSSEFTFDPSGATPTPPAPPPITQAQPAACPHPGSVISQPGNGARVAGVIQVTGVASIENFDYYKFEFRAPGAEEWSFIERYDNPVQGGVLGSWNSDTVGPGEYEFRLVVVDTIGNFPDPCVVRLIVQ